MAEKITIDATGRSLGRVATEAAMHLRGKHRPDYQPNRLADVSVEIVNAGALQMSEQKKDGTIYQRYSGYPSGRTEETFRSLVSRRGYDEAIRRTVHGMLPANRLRSKMLAQLTISE